MSRPSAARRVAADVLRGVREHDAYANLLLPSRIRDAGLSPRDAAFATDLTYGALRLRRRHDAVIALAAARPVERIDPDVLDLLRLGVHQLLESRVPAHAAVDETVALAALVAGRRTTGFVNAVLRAVARRSRDEWSAEIEAGPTGDALLGIRHSHPDWIVAAYREALAAEDREHELEALLAAGNAPPVVRLAALPGLAAPRPGPDSVSPIAVAAPGGDPGADPDVAAGRVRVQDEGSQLAALALARARPVRPGERWLDLCAGPGGKAAVLAAEASTGGAVLVANEIVPARARLVRDALAVFDPSPDVIESDGRTIGERFPGSFDRILLDAPCTGLGALRRRPEARWRKTPDDVPGLTALQDALLDAAVAALAPGGLLAYVTCSPHLPETRERVAAALDRHPVLERADAPAVLARIALRDLGLGAGTGDGRGAAQLWPHRHGTDAMFIQLLARRS